ncbi:hypothetical protein [Nitrospirillum viridazoti]|uniref:Heme oxygenase n=1 Tax=Nitrospirillum viridazoti CBAmc TaxID=1441467 RepID=A0A248JYQ7_9PROT|nr:hypothetical protein [Nitrospirillum amazonense]ASG23288.1 hypothetical protein Y958_20915 [Nitrospirillum amazonense CBAmc]TWB40048.1 hypothetical protein FBZ91_105283 [Nitrospirillum amazonense]
MQQSLDTVRGAFEADNAPLVPRVQAFLADILRTPASHARFMNELSLMEHMGSNKIMATQHGAGMDLPTLKHLAEEARHAFFFKRHAEGVARRPLDYVQADLLSPAAGRLYFQKLDIAVEQALAGEPPRSKVLYLHMSLIVEFRAVWFYHLYETALRGAGSKISLKSLLAEEQGHLSDMAERLGALGAWEPARLAAMCRAETTLFGTLLGRLERAVAAPTAVAA